MKAKLGKQRHSIPLASAEKLIIQKLTPVPYVPQLQFPENKNKVLVTSNAAFRSSIKYMK